MPTAISLLSYFSAKHKQQLGIKRIRVELYTDKNDA